MQMQTPSLKMIQKVEIEPKATKAGDHGFEPSLLTNKHCIPEHIRLTHTSPITTIEQNALWEHQVLHDLSELTLTHPQSKVCEVLY